MTMDDPRYPYGRFERPESLSEEARVAAIDRVAALPLALGAAVSGLDDPQLDTPYRDGGWTVRRLVHHVADSHLNAFLRFKLGLTENEPRIVAYDQDAWVATADADLPVDVSLRLIEALHARWVVLMRSLSAQAWERRILHPETGPMRLDQLLALYAWHGEHHRRHIVRLREGRKW